MSAATDAFSAAATTLAQAVADAANDPADAIRVLLPLAGWMPSPIPGSGPLAAEANAAQAAIAETLRTAACAALGGAAQAYRPTSYQDAQDTRATVCAALDAEATRCADSGLDASYQALKNLRTAVAVDLATKGANLAWLVEVTAAAPMPSLAEAWRLYQDTTREPGLVAQAGVVHPLFMPLRFEALNQ